MSTSEPVMVNNGDRTYVSLHTHSTHSIGDGISTPDDLAKRAAELGMPAMALTDHGRMSGLVSFEKACHEHNVKPIMGMEAYCCGIGRSRTERKNYTMDTRDLVGKPGHEKSCYHLILLAKDETGYDNLCRLTTESYATGFYYKPRIDYGLLHEHRDGLIVCSACVLGELSMAVQDDDIDKARRVIDWFRGEFGDDYFVEVQNHGLPMELNAMRTLRELADDSDVRTIVTNDSHYTLKGDAKLQKTVMLINRHKSWADADVRGSFFDDASVDGQRAIEDEHGGEGDSDPIFETSSELYVKSYDEMVEALRPNGGEDGRVERELANTLEIAERCEYEIPFIDPSDTDAYILPKYDVTTDVRYEEYERSSFAIPDYITKACVKELRDEGHDEVNEISDYLDASDMEALRFLMWLCEDGMHRRVIPKIDAGGNPMPEEMWIRNKPEGMHVIHTHKSPDEQWVRHQVEAGRTRDDMIQEYRDRLAYETGVVVAKRFVNYFLIVQSYVNYVRAQGEMVGPGRGCVTPDTMILTPNGAKQISKMHVGDYVYDEKGDICPITKVHQYNVHESMTDLTIFQGGHIRLTDDHMVLIAPAVHTQHYEEASNPNNKYRQYDDIAPMTQRTWVHASQIHKGDWVFVPIPSRQRTIVDRFDLAQFIPDNIKDRCVVTDDAIIRHVGFGNGHSTNALCIHAISRATGISRNALHDYIRNRVVTQQATISRLNEYMLQYGLTAEEWKMQFTGYHHDEICPRYIDMNSDLARFVGYYIADGDVHRGVIDLAFNTNDTTYINEYAQLSQRIFGQQMSLEVHANKPNLTTGHITSPIIAAFIKSLVPDTVENKRIPQLFMEQNDAFTLSLLTGLIDGDGSIRDKGKIKYTSISKTLIYQIRFLFLSLGEIGTVFTRHHVNHPTWHDSYTLSYTTSPLFEKLFNVPDKKGRQGTHTVTTIDGYICMRVKNNAQFNYKGTVYDLTVDTQSEPSYTTEAGIIHNSGAGSLLNYLSGITSVDPIPNDLLFFRFLNKDRKGYPDIDVDFSSHGRDDILWPHLREVYGKDSTAMVAAYTYFWGKAAIKAASRVLFDCSSCRTMTPEQRRAGKDESITLSNALCDLIDNRPHLDLSDELTDETDANGRPLGNEPLKALIKTDRRYQQIIDLALMLQGMISGESQHASAYILSPHPIVDKLPLMVSKDERERSTASGEPVQDYIIQYDGREIQDQLGYVKMDLLCINDLEVITQTIKKIHDAYGVDIDIDNIPFDCKTTFDLLRQGKTAGVFQFDGSPVPKRLITEGKADSLNDLSMINALDRPGALNMGMDKEFIERKRDKGKIEYFSPDAEDILKDTYGLACVARDSIVMTSEGEKYIQDIHVGDKVLAEDCQWHNVSAWYDKGIRETLRIRTDFGGELVCTPDHKILTSDGWVRADQLRKGMLIKGAMPSDMPDGVNNVRSIEPLDLQDWLIGLFLADGHSPKHGVPNISCGSRENAERIAEIARTVLPDMQNIHLTMTDGREHGSGVTWHVVFAQTPSGTHNGHFGKQAVQNDMNALLKQYGLFGKVKDEKKWPEKYSFSTIIGIIEGDGTDQAQILTLKHHDLAYSVYKALLEYGIHASIYLRGDKLAWIVSYSDIEHRIRPIARDYSGHDGCNGYYIPRKYLERYHDDMNIPYCIRVRYLAGKRNHMTPGVNLVKARQHFGWSCHDDEHPTWGKILSVMPDGMHHVYDITVDDNHSFLCNDLFLSNCFQESLMLLSENKNIVGFTPGEADTMRKILAHKDKAKIKGIVGKAHDRAAQNNVPKEIVDEFCDMAVASGSYSFNRSHSLAYALIAYRGAFLKTFFPDCFLSSVAQIKPQMKGKDKIPDYLNEARQLGVELRPPHVNWSDIGFSVPEPHVIAYGLERIKGVGAAAQTIVDERHAHGEFTDITDFCCRVPKSVTKTALKALVSAGALDNLGWTRRALEASVGDLAEFRKKWFKEREKNVGQLSLGLDIGTSVSATGDGSDDAGRTVSDVDAFYADGRHHNDHGTILMPPTTEEFPPYQMMEREHEAFGMYFSVTPEDWSQLARLEADEWLEGKRKESARQNREGVEIGGKRYRIINVSDVPSLPDSMRVVFTAMVEDVTPKFGDTRGYRLFKSGKGAMVFLIDWGVGAEGRFGFSPSESRVRLTCFERVWNGMPKPSPNAVVLVWGRVNVSDKFPTSVIADGVRTLQYDAVRFQGRKERADELMGRLRDIAARASDPSSVAYLIPRVSLPDRNAYDRFVADHVMHAKYDDLYGMAIVTYDGCADDDSDRVMRLAQTVGMVRYARDKYGATVTKVRLPMAESELARRF